MISRELELPALLGGHDGTFLSHYKLKNQNPEPAALVQLGESGVLEMW